MSVIGRSCSVCGARTAGKSRCAKHSGRGGPRPRPCVTCGRPTAGRDYCDEHEPPRRTYREQQQWRKAYADPEYRRNRMIALRRDNYACAVCGRGKVQGVRIEVDHVVAIIDGGTNDVTNLVTLCEEHHRDKTRADRAARRRRK